MIKKILLLMLALVCIMSVSAISAADVNTDNSVASVADTPGNFTELQGEINSISSGGTLELTKNYTNTDNFTMSGIVINKAITIDGKGYTIDGNGKSRIFNITDGITVTLKNITIINGYNNFNPNDPAKSAGGAITVKSSTLFIEDCIFKNSSPSSRGGAISTSGNITVINSTFINNEARGEDKYGGGAIWGSESIILINSSFINNTADGYQGEGGAISSNGDSLYIVGSNFINN
ncbi:MAG: hypothetical protein HUK28_05890, partial [Methanobrevibacter sp.]|nr:hypothetical protein [Methanobrevibacter sp.]